MYFTFYVASKPKQITLDDWLNDLIVNMEEKHYRQTLTICKDKEKLRKFYNEHKLDKWFNLPVLPNFNIDDIENHYEHFKIPKKSGGLRDIDAPDEELKLYLTNLKAYLEDTLNILTHNSAHAYVKCRSTITSVKIHQENNSHWFLKLDLKDFFPSHNLDYVMKTFEDIYPIGFMLEDETFKQNFRKALEYAFLNDKLPQGTPLSPTLTNILMVPMDFKIQHMLWAKKNSLVYTRYADDMCISSKYSFKFKDIESEIINIIEEQNAPFKLNKKKTRYGSRSGRNWNLGIMLNKDNEMTIGHKQNQRFRAMLANLIKDHKNNVEWSLEDKQVLTGLIAYYLEIQPEKTRKVIKTYEEKFNVSIKEILKNS